MKYAVEIIKDGKVWARHTVKTDNHCKAAAWLVARAVDGFEESEDARYEVDDDFPVDPEEIRETHDVRVRVHRIGATRQEVAEEYEMIKGMNEDPRSPFRGMIDMSGRL